MMGSSFNLLRWFRIDGSCVCHGLILFDKPEETQHHHIDLLPSIATTQSNPNSTFLHNHTIFNHHTAAFLHLLCQAAAAREGNVAIALFHYVTRCAQGGGDEGEDAGDRKRESSDVALVITSASSLTGGTASFVGDPYAAGLSVSEGLIVVGASIDAAMFCFFTASVSSATVSSCSASSAATSYSTTIGVSSSAACPVSIWSTTVRSADVGYCSSPSCGSSPSCSAPLDSAASGDSCMPSLVTSTMILSSL
ncbi:hypothetical protein Droror1_Dr00020359 [Drosera rotundifolia]